MPTSAYITFDIIDSAPNSVATRSKLKKPTRPQFMAPIRTRTKATLKSLSIIGPPNIALLNIYFVYNINMTKHKIIMGVLI